MKQAFLKYFGGKFMLRNKIIDCFPTEYTVFASCFLGSGGVEFSVDPIGHSEVWNDINKNLSNLYIVLKDTDSFLEFQKHCDLCLFSEFEFEKYKKLNNWYSVFFGF